MSSIFKVASPLLPSIASLIEAVLDISGSPHGSGIINFTDSNVNILPPLRGASQVGVHTFSVLDHSRQSQLFCDAGELKIPDALCNQPREIRVSMFYPACPPEEDGKNWSLSKDVQYFAPFFEPSLVANISQQLLGNATAMHNVMSHAVKNAPVCKGEYTMVMFTPAIGGQRQAYTQAASDLASLGYVAVTMDHLYLSGFVELSDDTVQAGMINETTDVLRAVELQKRDIKFLGEALTHRAQLNQLPIWTKQAGVAPKVCVFGHGLGGTIAYNIASKGRVACGGYLDLLTLPYPLNRGDSIMAHNNAMGIDERLDGLLRQTFPPNEAEGITNLSPAVDENLTELDNQPLDKALPDPHSIISQVKALKEGILKAIQGLIQGISRHATGSHDSAVENNAVRKRSVGGVDCCDGKEPCHQDGCDKGWNYHHRQRPCNEGHCDDEFDGCDDCEGFCDDDDDDRHHHGGPSPDNPNRTQPGAHGGREGGWVDHPDHGGHDIGRPDRYFGDRKCCPRRCRPERPCNDGNDCGRSHGGIHDHYDDFPEYPHNGGHRGHRGHPHGHPGGWDRYNGGSECPRCHSSVGHHHIGWEDVGEGHKWDDQDYEYDDEEDDYDEDEDEDEDYGEDEDEDDCEDDDEEDNRDEGEEEGDDDEDESDDEGEDEGEDDEEDEEDDGDDCGGEVPCLKGIKSDV